MENFLVFKRQILPIGPDKVFDIFGWPVANSTLLMFLFSILIFGFGFFIFRNKSRIPNKFEVFLEIVYEMISSQIKTITNSDYHTKRAFPLIASIFVFVGLSNYSSLIPGLGNITWEGVPIFRNPTADFNTTFGLAFGALVILHLITIKDFGALGYLKKFIPVVQLKEDLKKGYLSPVYIFVTILIACLDIIGEFAKILSPSLRLFGNMYAGDVLTTVLVGIFAFVLPSFWVAFGLLGALIQTVVFGSLITLFYMQAAGPEPGDD
jgi:F-type H+-transporting ATPase subunit a